jgi:hypothetical protein
MDEISFASSQREEKYPPAIMKSTELPHEYSPNPILLFLPRGKELRIKINKTSKVKIKKKKNKQENRRNLILGIVQSQVSKFPKYPIVTYLLYVDYAAQRPPQTRQRKLTN